MRNHQQSLIGLLNSSSSEFEKEALAQFILLDTDAIAHTFVDVAFMVTAMKFIQEQYWILSKDRDLELKTINFQGFVKKLFKVELAPILFLHSELEASSIEEVETIKNKASVILDLISKYVKGFALAEKHIFAVSAAKFISELIEYEHQIISKKQDQNLHLGYSLDRTFDELDRIFGLDYLVDKKILPTADFGTERVFEGSGMGVQSSYSTILLALRYLRIPKGARFIDLGAGFGRVGFVVGLLRPDVIFSGYEIVTERVAVVNKAIQDFGLEKNVKFIAQDLSSLDFVIPDADIYYLYDPFSVETYKHVLTQLSVIATRKKINIITSGETRQVMQELSQRGRWSPPQIFESGHFCLFRSL